MATDETRQAAARIEVCSPCARFLATEIDDRLGRLYDEAETSFHEFPAYTLQLGRECGQIIALKFLEAENYPPIPGDDFFAILKYRPFHGKPRRPLLDGLHTLRTRGNRAAHQKKVAWIRRTYPGSRPRP